MRFNFDMDGTIVDLYGVKGWLKMLCNEDATPYATAKPLVNMSRLARALNKTLRNGHEIAIISWGAKDSTQQYLEKVTQAKEKWLRTHLPSVHWTDIKVVPYGTPKSSVTNGVLFDDEEKNLRDWGQGAYLPSQIFPILATY